MDDVVACPVLIVSGPRRGQVCAVKCGKGAVTCARHKAYAAQVPMSDGTGILLELPQHVLDVIVEKVAALKDKTVAYNTLCSLRATSQSCRSAAIRALDTCDTANTIQKYEGLRGGKSWPSLTKSRLQNLTFGRGCERCGTERVTKIHWPIPVRLCRDCFKASTTNVWRVQNDYGIGKHVTDNLPQVTITGWNPHVRFGPRDYVYNVVLTGHVEEAIKCSLSNYSRVVELNKTLPKQHKELRRCLASACKIPYSTHKPLDADARLSLSTTWREAAGDLNDQVLVHELAERIKVDLWEHDVKSKANSVLANVYQCIGYNCLQLLGGYAGVEGIAKDVIKRADLQGGCNIPLMRELDHAAHLLISQHVLPIVRQQGNQKLLKQKQKLECASQLLEWLKEQLGVTFQSLPCTTYDGSWSEYNHPLTPLLRKLDSILDELDPSKALDKIRLYDAFKTLCKDKVQRSRIGRALLLTLCKDLLDQEIRRAPKQCRDDIQSRGTILLKTLKDRTPIPQFPIDINSIAERAFETIRPGIQECIDAYVKAVAMQRCFNASYGCRASIQGCKDIVHHIGDCKLPPPGQEANDWFVKTVLPNVPSALLHWNNKTNGKCPFCDHTGPGNTFMGHFTSVHGKLVRRLGVLEAL